MEDVVIAGLHAMYYQMLRAKLNRMHADGLLGACGDAKCGGDERGAAWGALLMVSTKLIACMQMDFLEHAAVDDVVVMSVVLDEVRHRNASVYQRLRALCAAPARRFYVFANEHHR